MKSQKFVAVTCLLLAAAALTSGADSSAPAAAPASAPAAAPAHAGASHKSSPTSTQARQSPISAAASMVGALGSLVPGLITNVAPLVLLFGIGALMMPSLGMSAMGLLRESRRSASDQPVPGLQLPAGPFGHYAARPIQTSPQDIYYFTKRSLPSLVSSFNSEPLRAGLQDLLERVARAIDNADKRYN